MEAGAIILSGGEGSRLGYKEKGMLPFHGESLVERKVRLLSGRFSEIVVVTNRPELYSDLSNAVVVKDDEPYRGPLHGLSCGLKAAKHHVNFLCAVDMPFVKHELIDHFETVLPGRDVVVGRLGGHVEPLFGFYSKKALPVIESLLSDPQSSLRAVADGAGAWFVDEAQIKRHDPDLFSYENINTAEDLKRCLDIGRNP